MDHDEARERLLAERTEVADLLAGTESSAREDRETEDEDAQVYDSDAAPDLVAEGMDDAIADSLRDRLAALDRALKRLEDGTYGRSVRSGLPIPDERLAADPAAELTIEEARAAT
jgi:DnaK suppressor protein